MTPRSEGSLGSEGNSVDPITQSDLVDLLVEHAQHPHHYGEKADADITQMGGNPGCGDILTLYLKLDGERLTELTFTGQGCTISQAAASILSDQVAGLALGEILNLDYHIVQDTLGAELVALRPRCATLALDTLKVAARLAREKTARNV